MGHISLLSVYTLDLTETTRIFHYLAWDDPMLEQEAGYGRFICSLTAHLGFESASKSKILLVALPQAFGLLLHSVAHLREPAGGFECIEESWTRLGHVSTLETELTLLSDGVGAI